ncbi:hypothetical protein C810_01380 [Lachnospiraceae bacterium A2]|jgi:hypothetical protein|nr:hypothetical protein C810_01380 [Lachnospiraceae bacterium A2]
MRRIKEFISFWLYYPKLLSYLKEKDRHSFEIFKKIGRFPYAKQYSRIKIDFENFNKSELPWESEDFCEWKSIYDKEPIERCTK